MEDDSPARHDRDAKRRPLVLHVRTVTGTGGGPEKTILRSPPYLRAAGWDAQCLYLHPPQDPSFEVLRRRADAWGTPLLDLPDHGPCDLRLVRELVGVCDRLRPDIWHGHDYKSDPLGLVMRRARKEIFLVSTVHGWGVPGRRVRLYRWIHQLSLRGFDRVICVSEDLKRQCIRAGIPARFCRVIENGVDTDLYARREPNEAAKARLGLTGDVFLVGAVGRLSPEKDYPTLLRAARRLTEVGSPIRVMIVGEGPEHERLAALIQRDRLQGTVTLEGFQSDTLTYYQGFDAFVITSLDEGLPNVLLEALACEVPVVSTPVGGIGRVIEDGVNGLTIRPGDDIGLAVALRQLRDSDLRQRLGRAGRAIVQERYSFERRMRRVMAVYRELLETRTR
ncbi:MAG: hypothetical protein Kow0040_13260 [Thermogutta sp.]